MALLPAPMCPPTTPGTRVQGIACGQHHSMALSASGEVFTWGADAQGCLGHGGGWFSGGGTEWRPRVLRTLSTHDVRSVSAGYAHSGAVTAGGEAFLWGDPDFVPGVSRARVSKVDTPRLVSWGWERAIWRGWEFRGGVTWDWVARSAWRLGAALRSSTSSTAAS